MNTGKAQQIILLSALATFGFGFVNSFSKENRQAHGEFPAPYHVRLFVGASVVFITLSAMAEFVPRIAAPLAVAMGTTATMTQGAPVIEQLIALGADAPAQALPGTDPKRRALLKAASKPGVKPLSPNPPNTGD